MVGRIMTFRGDEFRADFTLLRKNFSLNEFFFVVLDWALTYFYYITKYSCSVLEELTAAGERIANASCTIAVP